MATYSTDPSKPQDSIGAWVLRAEDGHYGVAQAGGEVTAFDPYDNQSTDVVLPNGAKVVLGYDARNDSLRASPQLGLPAEAPKAFEILAGFAQE